MIVAMGSIFRNSDAYLDRYFAQAGALHQALAQRGHVLRLVLAEGDSTDGTREGLHARARALGIGHDIVKRDHGGPVYGSVDTADRWRSISYVCNGVLDLLKPYDDLFVYVESDLIWEPATLMSLLAHVLPDEAADLPVAVPMCFHVTGRFYDVWGHRRSGLNFSPDPPFHPDLAVVSECILYGMDSAGSCLAMRAEVARTCRFDPPEQGIVGFCRDIRAKGYSIWLDPTLKVIHP